MSMTLDDRDAIRAFRHGDDSVFEGVVAEYRLELLRHARRRSPDDATAEDLVQETFVRAYRSFGRLPEDSRVRPWLHQILRNVCIDDAHRRRRELDKVDRVIAQPVDAAVEAGPEAALGLDVDSHLLTEALADLSAAHRDAFVQRVVVGLDYDEIAAREGVSETNARARVSRARSALRRALQGAAAIPLGVYLMIRRPGRGIAAPSDPTSTATASETAGNASRIATAFAPAVETANAVAASAPTSVPLLTKAAIGVGAVAVTLSAAPERPVERPPAVEVTAEIQSPVDEPIVVTAPVVVAVPDSTAPVVAAPVTTVPPTTVPETAPPTTLAALLEAPVTEAPAATAPVATAAPTTAAPTTVPTTTVPPTTAPTTTEVASAPPLAGGTLRGSVSVTPSGPRLDLSGSVTLASGESSNSGSLSGRLGVGAPDPAGSMRLDGTFSVQLPSGTVELRLAGYGTSSEVPVAGAVPTSLSMSGVYRASGATGQLLTSGSFSGSLSGGSLSLTLTA